MLLIIVTGLSGSGKSVVLKALEDCEFYCVDNLPSNLLPQTAEHLASTGNERIAVSIDTRSTTLETLPGHISKMKSQGIDLQLLFLESNTETLVKRFSETRRRHPLSDQNKTLEESIQAERELLAELADIGLRLDTSDLSANTLRGWVKDVVATNHDGLTLLFESFGFKNGIPLDADYVFDVRCLPNPHYDARLQPLTGRDPAVVEFLENQQDVVAMYDDIRKFIERWLPLFIRDNRSYLTVAIGCTGGRHRSVYFAEKLATHFQAGISKVLVRHRQLA